MKAARRLPLLLAAVSLACCATVSTRDPGAGFILISEQEEFAIGDRFADTLARGNPSTRKPPAAFIDVPGGYLGSIGRRLLASSKRPGVPCAFRVIAEDAINAFAVPGHIYVYRGLVALCETESEFAAVLAHEIGHVVGRHTAKNVSSAMALSLGEEVFLQAVGAGDITRLATSLVLTGAVKRFGRDEERQADLLAVEQCVAAGFDPRGAVSVFRKFVRIFNEKPNLIDGFFADHPWSAERAANVERFIATLRVPEQLVADSDAYQEWRRRVLATGGNDNRDQDGQ